jgi:monofunctional biosynthetic peptidoglycan transglycosylase
MTAPGAVVLSTLIALLASGPSQDSDERLLFDSGRDSAADWLIVNDGVMGGVSSSAFADSDSAFATFAGELSLENNGGFASVRGLVDEGAVAGGAAIAMRVRGDGRTYQLRFRTDRRFDGISYMAEFSTDARDWQTVTISLAAFEPTWRGRRPRGAPPLDPARIQQIGILLADKNEGPFRLDVDWIRVTE